MRPLSRSGKQLSVRRRQVLFALYRRNPTVTRIIAHDLNITIYSARNALQDLRTRSLASFDGTWTLTPVGASLASALLADKP